MTEDQLELLLKARQSLSAASVLLDNGFPDYATSRAYYTMFYHPTLNQERSRGVFSSYTESPLARSASVDERYSARFGTVARVLWGMRSHDCCLGMMLLVTPIGIEIKKESKKNACLI